MLINEEVNDRDVLNQVITAMQKLQPEDRERIFQTVKTFFKIDATGPRANNHEGMTSGKDGASSARVSFSDDLVESPKQFMLEKQPQTDVERVACLAYYLTHYRDTPHFKTLDLSQLNTEAAQRKFANAALSVNNAATRGYLASATKGLRQLSAAGEQYVRALPDREAARDIMASSMPRKYAKRRGKESVNEKAKKQ